MKIIMFGAGAHTRRDMDTDAILREVDYFVDNSPAYIGGSYLGKPIKAPSALLEEDKKNILIVIASLIYKTEITIQLMRMGFNEHFHFEWALDVTKNPKYGGGGYYFPLNWKDKKNQLAISDNATDEFYNGRLMTLFSMIDLTTYQSVVDLGAGNERAREFLPVHISYYPVDYIQHTAQTILYDLNADFPDSLMLGYSSESTVIVSSGNISYISDWKTYLKQISENCCCLLLSMGYALGEFPLYGAKRSHLFSNEVIIEMSNFGFLLTGSLDFRLRQQCMRFEKCLR
jgi:hypothetical protein